MQKSASKDITAYIQNAPKQAQEQLRILRKKIKEILPDAEEKISYGIPTFDLHRTHIVHFGGYAKHIGFYPGASGIAHFKKELSKYHVSKGTVQFPIDTPLPFPLIEKIVRFRTKETIKNLKVK